MAARPASRGQACGNSTYAGARNITHVNSNARVYNVAYSLYLYNSNLLDFCFFAAHHIHFMFPHSVYMDLIFVQTLGKAASRLFSAWLSPPPKPRTRRELDNTTTCCKPEPVTKTIPSHPFDPLEPEEISRVRQSSIFNHGLCTEPYTASRLQESFVRTSGDMNPTFVSSLYWSRPRSR